MFIRTLRTENNEIVNEYKVLDDKNEEGTTLAKRRLSLLAKGVPLKPLGMAIFFLGDLVKLATKRTWFIDSNGKLFQYKKTKAVPLLFGRIILQINIPSGGSVIEVEGIPARFKCLYSPVNGEKYAGVLKYGIGYILYGLYVDKPNDTWRKI